MKGRVKMKKDLAKIISLLFVLVFIVSVSFAGCGNNNADTTTTTTAAGTAAAQTTEEKKEPVELTLLTQDSYVAEASYANPEKLPVFAELMKRTNTRLVFEVAAPGNYPELVKTRMAAGTDLPDIVQLMGFDVKSAQDLGKNGITIPLNDYIDKVMPDYKNKIDVELPEARFLTTADNGMIYYFTGLNYSEGWNVYNLFIRKDWLDKAGIARMPETLDEFHAALKAFQDKDVNGNGKKDEVYTDNTYTMSMLTLTASFGLPPYLGQGVDESGKVYYGFVQPQTKELLMFLNKLYKEKLLDPDYFTMNATTFTEKIAKNVISSFSGFPKHGEYYGGFAKDVQGVNYQPLKPLKSDLVQNPGICGTIKTIEPSYKFAITKDCKVPEAAAKFLNYLYTDEATTLLAWGREGVDYTVVNGQKQFTEDTKAKIAADGTYLSKLGCLPYNLPRWRVVSLDEWNNQTPYRDIDAIKELIKFPITAQLKLAPGTEQENTELQNMGNEFATYCEEMKIKFITGEESFDKWDEYTRTAAELGLDRFLAVWQAQYDRIAEFEK